jgi:ATP-dependent DNA helicase RecG
MPDTVPAQLKKTEAIELNSIVDRVLETMSPERAAIMKAAASKKVPKTAKKVKRAIDMDKFGMNTEAEWLLIAPARYEDYANENKDLKDLVAGNHALVRGKITAQDYFKDSKKPLAPAFYKVANRMMMTITNNKHQSIKVAVFGRPYFQWKDQHIGDEILIRAMPKQSFLGNGLELSGAEIVPRGFVGKIVPIYPNIKVTKGEKLREKVDEFLYLMDHAAQIVEEDTGWSEKSEVIVMPDISGFATPKDLLQALHRPKTVDEGEKARRSARLISGLALMRNTLIRGEMIEEDPDSAIPIDQALLDRLKTHLPFQITNDQEKAMDGIAASLRSNVPMSGLLSGDVGSGKTAAFLLPLVAAHMVGKRAVLLTPNLLLISQVAREARSFFPDIPVCTVTGSGIDGDPNNSLLIGSTALIHAFKKGKIKHAPDFLVVDEQHKFSIEQRQALAGDHTNILEATATPIPRTAALITHGSADVFLLREIPVEKNIITEIITPETALGARNKLIESISRGEQAAVVYPLVETDDPEKSRVAVLSSMDNWKKYIPEDRIAVLHGKMKDEEKTSVLDAFRNGEKDLLLTSIVIEVGVTLPSLKTMLVTDADRFGVVTLHQLRGRLARHGGEGHMMLYTSEPTPEGMERLGLLVQHSDGFVLAEKDAEIRGFGDLIGNDGDAQSGKTRTLFLGVNVGPKEISYASNLYRRAGRMDALDFGVAESQLDPIDLPVLPGEIDLEKASSFTDKSYPSPNSINNDYTNGSPSAKPSQVQMTIDESLQAQVPTHALKQALTQDQGEEQAHPSIDTEESPRVRRGFKFHR